LGAETRLNGPQAMAISLDGAQLYVASGNDLVVFARDPESGMLTLVQTVKDNTNGVDGVGGAAALALSPDGAHLYAAGKLDDALAVFARDSASGALSFVEVDRQAVDGGDGLGGVDAVAGSPAGAPGEGVTAPDCNDGATCTEKRCVSGECALPRCGLDGGMCELRDAEPDLENLAGCTPMRQTLQRALKLRLRQARAQLRAAK